MARRVGGGRTSSQCRRLGVGRRTMSLWSRITNVFHSERHLQEIREELEFHLAMDQANGRDAREARLRLGNVARIAEETHAAGTVAWLELALQDAKYGLRQLRKSPAESVSIRRSDALTRLALSGF